MASPIRLVKAFWRRLVRASKTDTYRGASNALFGGLADRFGDAFQGLEEDLKSANFDILYRTYVSEIFMSFTLAFITGLGISGILIYFYNPPLIFTLVLALMLPTIFGSAAAALLVFYPTWRARNRARDINRNMPFALNHMSAISGSGVPPSSLFQLLVDFEEYGAIAEEADKVARKVQVFGEDVTTALREVAQQTPSDDLREVFYGMVSTIETGGSLQDFLDERAQRALFDYKMKSQREIERLSTFASFYTAILVAAPLFLVTILAVLETIGGGLFGYPIKARCGFINALLGACPIGVIDIGAYILIPIANIVFILALEVTQPEI
ncbi:MAG: type II secretion system F family protein [Candidatus Nanohaloarchaea archaeon]|nr:type II secretion system F family protein [Candidatus Nanohaloarchaea archaeon]